MFSCECCENFKSSFSVEWKKIWTKVFLLWNYFTLMVHFYTPWNVRKSLVSWRFQGVKKLKISLIWVKHMFQLSRFEKTTPVLPFLLKISCFEVILAWMSDIYEFLKSIILFRNLIWKSWLLGTKLVALGYPLHHEL